MSFYFCVPFIALLMLSYPMSIWTYYSIWAGVEFWQVLSDKNFILVFYENKKQLGALTEKTTNLMSLHDWPYTFYFNDMKSMDYNLKRQYKRLCKILFPMPTSILKKIFLFFSQWANVLRQGHSLHLVCHFRPLEMISSC